ncbi:hypothetical protein JCM8547_001621 [Rhodosporidiobolus lusitaniae]
MQLAYPTTHSGSYPSAYTSPASFYPSPVSPSVILPNPHSLSRPSRSYSSPYAPSPTSSRIEVSPGMKERLLRKRGNSAASGGSFALRSPPLSSIGQARQSPYLPEPTSGLPPTGETVERIFLNAISFPARLSRFVSLWRSLHCSPSAQLSLVYPPSSPYSVSPSQLDIVSVPDCLSSSRHDGGCTWVRVPALLARVDLLSTEMRRLVKVTPAVPALHSALSERERTMMVDGDRWTFVKHGPELDTAFWDVLLDGGTRIKVTFDQAFRG